MFLIGRRSTESGVSSAILRIFSIFCVQNMQYELGGVGRSSGVHSWGLLSKCSGIWIPGAFPMESMVKLQHFRFDELQSHHSVIECCSKFCAGIFHLCELV